MGDVLEAELLDAFRNGRVLDCADDGARRGVDAALLRRCCLELRDQVDPHGVRLKSAEVLGGLDLTGLDVPFPLRFEACGFESAPRQQAELAADAGYLDRVLDTGHARARRPGHACRRARRARQWPTPIRAACQPLLGRRRYLGHYLGI